MIGGTLLSLKSRSAPRENRIQVNSSDSARQQLSGMSRWDDDMDLCEHWRLWQNDETLALHWIVRTRRGRLLMSLN